MADIKKEAREEFHGKQRTYDANMGTFTASARVFQGGNIHEDVTDGTRVGTYSAPIMPGYLLKWDTGADFKMSRVAQNDTGELAVAVAENVMGLAGGDWRVLARMLADADVLVFEAAGAITRGDKVDISNEAYDDNKPHGLRVVTAFGAGLGRALNATSAAGEKVAVEISRNRVD